MDLETIIKKKNEFIKDDSSTASEDYINMLKEHGVTEETIPIIIERYPIDNGNTFYEYIKSLSSTKLKSVIKSLKDSDYIKNNKSEYIYELLFGFLLYILTIKKFNAHIIRAFDLITQKIRNDKLTSSGYTNAYINSFVKSITDDKTLPKWNQLNITSKRLTKIIEVLLPPLEGIDNDQSVTIVSNWLKDGQNIIPFLKQAEAKEKEYKKKSDETCNKHNQEVETLNTCINNLKKTLEMKESEIYTLKAKIANCEKKLDTEIQKRKSAENEVEERKNLNQTQVHYQEMSINSLKEEIGDALKAEYEDFYETIDVEMSDLLGEIYRDKLNQIARILEQKEIKVK